MGLATQAPSILAECLLGWSRGEDTIDAEAGAWVVAETVLLIRSALKSR